AFLPSACSSGSSLALSTRLSSTAHAQPYGRSHEGWSRRKSASASIFLSLRCVESTSMASSRQLAVRPSSVPSSEASRQCMCTLECQSLEFANAGFFSTAGTMSARLATTWWAAYGYSRVMLLSATSAKGWMKCSGDGICAPVLTRESSSCDVVGGHRLRYRDSAISLDSIHLEFRQRPSTTPVRGVAVRSCPGSDRK